MGQNVVSRKPGQHEQQDRLLKQILQEIKECRKLDVTFSIPNVDKILEIVKEIQERLAGGGGLTEAQEQALAEKLRESTGPLKSAVEANQPNPTQVP